MHRSWSRPTPRAARRMRHSSKPCSHASAAWWLSGWRESRRIDLAVASGPRQAMIEAKFQTFLILLAVLAGTALVARRFNIAPAILLMLSGIGLAFVPGMPPVELPPELVLLMVLPPLIYSPSVAMSWREFRNNLHPIVLLAVRP